MGLLSSGIGVFNKKKKNDDIISQAALASMMEKSSNVTEFNSIMDDYLKNKKQEKISIDQQIKTQQKRLNVSDKYLQDLPLEKSLTVTKQVGTLLGAAGIALIEQGISSSVDIAILKTRDVAKEARLGNIKSFGTGLASSIIGGAIAGSVVPVLGTAVGAIGGALLYTTTQLFTSFNTKRKEDVNTTEANKEANINILTLGNIASTGNRKFR